MKLNKKGQSMVETAIVLPIILLLLLGMVEFSRIFGSYLLIINASREGARMASIGKSDTEVVDAVKTKAALLNTSDIQVTITPEDYDRKTGEDVEVDVKYKVDIYAPVISSILPDPFNMETNTIMRVE